METFWMVRATMPVKLHMKILLVFMKKINTNVPFY